MTTWDKATWATIYPNGKFGGAVSGPIQTIDEDWVTILVEGGQFDGQEETGETAEAEFDGM
jgi:hypothetical protein